MKKITIYTLMLMVFAAVSLNTHAQTTIWEENFDDPSLQGKGAMGPGNVLDTTGITNWFIDVTGASLSASSDWWMVNNMVFEGRDLDGWAEWQTEDIDINGYNNVTFSVDLVTDGSFETSDTLQVLYSIDGGQPTLSLELTEEISQMTHTESVSGSSLVIYIRAYNNAGSEYYRFDNVIVSGNMPGAVINPTDFAATAIGENQIDLSWVENANGNDVLIAFNSTDTFGDPLDGSSYPSGSSIPGGGTSLGTDDDEFYSHTGLTPDTWYYYKVWSVDGSLTYSSGVTGSAKTFVSTPTLFINEFMALNDTTLQNEFGNYEDWIEIYNPGPTDVNLQGLYITDDLTNPAQYMLPDTLLMANDWILIWADNENTGVHTNFSLNGSGEEIGLYGSDGVTPIDTYTFSSATPDISEARETDGDVNWTYFMVPNPGATNNTAHVVVTSPNGGESWEQNSTQDITWFNQNFTGDVQIELLGTNAQVLETSYGNTGTYQWMIPAGQPVASDYKVKVSAAGVGPQDESNDVFSIIAEGSLPQPGDIIITEVMQNSSAVSDNDGEWVEIFNTTDGDLDLNGWIIKDDDYDSHTIASSVVVPANGFAVLGRNSDPALNGDYTADYQYDNFFLSNSSDEVVLISPDGMTEIDRIGYDGGPNWPDPNGASMVFTGVPADDNNDPAFWITATLREPTYGVDPSGDLGSPGTNGQDQNLTSGGIANPGGFTATGMSETQIDLSWTENGNGDDVLLAFSLTNTFGDPVDGNTYPSGTTIPGGGTSLGVDTDEFFSHTSLNPDTWYYYKAWSLDGSTAYSNGVADSAKTFGAVPTLFINEFMALNYSTLQNEFGNYEDWIEIYNPGPTDVNLQGLYITDDLTNPTQYMLPDTLLPANDWILIWADNENTGVHTNFALSGAGEEIGLYGQDGATPIDTYVFASATPDISEARETDGDANWVYFMVPNPGATNNTSHVVVTSPNGGESWEQNSTQDITWFNQNFTGDVQIELLGSNAQILETSYANTGTYQWTIPAGQAVASDYKVKISAAGSAPMDESDDTFSIVAEGSLPSPGDIMVTELIQNPSAVSDGDGEWFEVFNTTGDDIDLMGWTIKDDDFDEHIVASSVIVPANGFAVLGVNNDPLVNGDYTCDYQYDNLYLSNGADEVVLISPDGVTEIDRITYDGGTNWPDPNGASMVFTGTVADDNNDPAFWITATLREPTYSVDPAGDLGSPGTNGQDQNLTTTVSYSLDMTVILEGPFNGTNMNTNLLGAGIIPVDQPFNQAPWNYTGTESADPTPANVVDWVLIELRDADIADNATGSSMIAQKAAFLLDDGTVVDTDGTSLLQFTETINQNLFVVVWHRNHLGVMSNFALSLNAGVYTYDFTTSVDQVYGGINGHKEVDPGVWGMIGGDGNIDGQISNADKNSVWNPQAGTSGYLAGDYNLDTQVENVDKNIIWVPNSGNGSQVPDGSNATAGYKSQVPK